MECGKVFEKRFTLDVKRFTLRMMIKSKVFGKTFKV